MSEEIPGYVGRVSFSPFFNGNLSGVEMSPEVAIFLKDILILRERSTGEETDIHYYEYDLDLHDVRVHSRKGGYRLPSAKEMLCLAVGNHLPGFECGVIVAGHYAPHGYLVFAWDEVAREKKMFFIKKEELPTFVDREPWIVLPLVLL